MSTLQLLDAAGRRRSPATLPGFHAGRPPRNKGFRYPPDPPRVEEVIAVMRRASETDHGLRLRALIVVLWRAGLRIGEAMALTEPDLDPSRDSILVRQGKGGAARGRHGQLGLRSAPAVARAQARDAGRDAVLRDRWPDAWEALDACSCAQPPAPDLNEGGGAAPLRSPPAPPRPRRRDGPRGCLAEGDPTPARPRQPRRDVGLSRRHRHRGNHRHSPQPARADDLRKRRTAHLSPGALLLAWEGAVCSLGPQSHRALSLCAEAIPESTVGPPPMTWSAVDGGHVRFVVALAGGRGEIVEPFDLLRAELDAVGCRVLFDAGDALGAGDRGDVVALGEQPCQCDLRRCGFQLGSDGLDLIDDAEVFLEVALGEARVALAPVVVAQLLGGADRPGEEAVPERRVGHEANAQFAQQRH